MVGSSDRFQESAGSEAAPVHRSGPLDTRAAAIAKNDLDVGASFTIGTLQALAAQNKKVQAWSTSPPYGYLDVCSRSLDFQTEDPTWSNPQLRWAVNYAINRKSIINVAFQGASLGSTTMLPAYPGFAPYFKLLAKSGVYKTYPISTSSPALAKKKIEAQGYSLQGGTYKKGGKSLSLEVTTFNDPTMVSIASTIVEQLKAIGIDASVRSLAIPNFIDSLLGGKFEANVFFGACGSTVDPWQSMDAFNVSHYAAPGQTSAGFYANTFRWNTPTAKSYSAMVNQIGKLVPGRSENQSLVRQGDEPVLLGAPLDPARPEPADQPDEQHLLDELADEDESVHLDGLRRADRHVRAPQHQACKVDRRS